jgi:TrpR-related protein YerC/YecD
MANVRRDPERDYLFEAILTLETVDDCYRFFDDLCTVKEISEMARRMSVAKMLDENTVYNDIVARTGLSTATISRVNRCLRYGSDGYRDVLDRLKLKEKEKEGTE